MTMQEHDHEYLTASEAARLLRMSRARLYQLVKARLIPAIRRPGSNQLYFVRRDLIQWMESGRIEVAVEKVGLLDTHDWPVYHRNPLYRSDTGRAGG